MNRDNFFVKLKNNIYNMNTFAEYAKGGIKKSILYAFILSLIIGGIQGIFMGFKMKNSIDKSVVELSDSKYDFSIKNGILKMNNSPLKFNEDGMIVYIDSNDSLNQSAKVENEYVHGDIYMTFLKDGIKVGTNGISKEMLYKDLFVDEYTNKEIIDDLRLVGAVVIPLTAVSMIIQYFITGLLNYLLIAAISIIIGMFMGLRMKSSAMYSLAIYASTLPSIILIPFRVIRPDVYFDTAFVAGTVIYIIFILRYIKKDLLKKIKL